MLTVCNQLGVTVSHKTVLTTLQEMATRWQDSISPFLRAGGHLTLVADNIDWVVKPRFSTLGRGNKSLHWMSSAFVLSRISGTGLNDSSPKKAPQNFAVADFYHSKEDATRMKGMMLSLVARTLTEVIPAWAKIFSSLDLMPDNPYRVQLRQKSTMVPLPIVFEDEKTKEGMLAFLRETRERMLSLMPDGDLRKYLLPLVGDQLTVNMVRNSQGGDKRPFFFFFFFLPLFCLIFFPSWLPRTRGGSS